MYYTFLTKKTCNNKLLLLILHRVFHGIRLLRFKIGCRETVNLFLPQRTVGAILFIYGKAKHACQTYKPRLLKTLFAPIHTRFRDELMLRKTLFTSAQGKSSTRQSISRDTRLQ